MKISKELETKIKEFKKRRPEEKLGPVISVIYKTFSRSCDIVAVKFTNGCTVNFVVQKSWMK